MIPDQSGYFTDRIVIKFQAAQDGFGHLFTFRCVHLEMIASIFIRLSHDWFRNIMKQHRQAKYLIRTDQHHTVQNMLAHRITVMRCILFRLHTPVKLRQKLFRDSGLICHPQIIRMRRSQKFHKFSLDSFCADTLQIWCQCTNTALCFFFNRKSQLCRKTYRTENAKRIFMEAFHRISDAADDLRLHVFHSVKKIDQTSYRMIRHRIDRKITSFQVFFKARSKHHLLRMAAVFIVTIHAVSRHFIAFFVHQYSYGAMLQPGIHCAVKKLFYLLRRCRSRNIPVIWCTSQDRIPHTAADHIGFITVFL